MTLHTKVREDKIKGLLRMHPVHGRVFAPWGVFGKMYAVSEEVEYEELSKMPTLLQRFLCKYSSRNVLNYLYHA